MNNDSQRRETREVVGRVLINPRGFGFLEVESDGEESLRAFIAPPDLNAYLLDDVIAATLEQSKDGRWSAHNLQLYERPRTELVGEVVQRRGVFSLRVDREVSNTDWPLDSRGQSLVVGETIVARIHDRTAVLLRQLEADDEPSLARVIARHRIATEWSPQALAQARTLCQKPHTLGHRRDLRDVPTVTIDAPSTRDIDDAISVIAADRSGALRLLVSIADPSDFIAQDSPLDREAEQRATSTYLAGRTLPMLPDELSSGHLSLLPGLDRCALTAELRIDAEGHVIAVDVYESLICSHARLNYTESAAFLDHNEVSEAMEPVRAAMPWFRAAGARLGAARARRGGVRIAQDEAKITVDPATGQASAIEAHRPNSAHLLIERFMVAANEAIAQWLTDRGVPALLRVHDVPRADVVGDLAEIAENFGYAAGFGNVLTPRSLAAFDAQIEGSPMEPAIRSVLLRSLGPARYQVTPSQHFGLGAPLYLHFTSPLRRYADFIVHRSIRAFLQGERRWTYNDPELESLAQHINARARNAANAERDRRKMLNAQYMSDRIGQQFSARITRLRSFAMVAQLDASFIEGSINVESMSGGPYTLDDRETHLRGETRTFTIGQAVTIEVLSADTALGRVEFALVK
ncbi:MAG: VacB/RNase II family 3'-5' exoribonuclease [Deltaproteobacteria bacterium]|nr:VacB/RNase II family 3'-5' exoribonuclease [Deltaproteobacteria bacterium]